MGLALGAIALAGLYYQLFAAPPEEPITGMFAPYPWLETTFMSGMFGLVGIGAVLFPFAMKGFSLGAQPTTMRKVVGFVWYLSGLGFFSFRRVKLLHSHRFNPSHDAKVTELLSRIAFADRA